MLAQAAAIVVMAQGNALTGGLAFAPAQVRATVGERVTWTNTDLLATHSVTEVHRLFDLAGLGPGATRARVFEAGTFDYSSAAYPGMTGSVAVPPSLSLVGRGRSRRVVVRWAANTPAAGLAYDAEFRRRGGEWRPLATKTVEPVASRPAGRRGTVTRFRARLRAAADASRASGWSPVASIKSR